MCLCCAALPCEWLDTDRSSISPSHLSNPSHPLAALRTALLKAANSGCSICSRPHPLLLKSPHVFNGDSVPSLTSSAWVRSQHCCSPSICLLSVILSFSIHHSLVFAPCLPSCFLSASLPQLLPPRSSAWYHHHSSSRNTYVLLSLSVQHLCRLEFAGPRQKVFFLCVCVCVCVCVEEGREGRQHPGTLDQHFIKICGDLGTDLLLLLQLSPLSCLFIISFLFFFIATPGMLNVDWWMFPNCASLTLSATTTSRCIPFPTSLFILHSILADRIFFYFFASILFNQKLCLNHLWRRCHA